MNYDLLVSVSLESVPLNQGKHNMGPLEEELVFIENEKLFPYPPILHPLPHTLTHSVKDYF